MEQGIYNLPADQYHADPAPTASLSSSIAKILLDQSPRHAWMAHSRLNPAYTREEDSRFDLGSAAHMMLLERRTDKIVVVNANDWRTKAAKEERDAARAAGCYPILARHYDDVSNMVAAAIVFLQRTELGDILDTGDTERTVLWQESPHPGLLRHVPSDIWCRCRPDLMSADRRIILDYKSTASAAPDDFAKQIGRMGYDLQAEFYTRGLEAITGREDTVFVFLAQEITAPYGCSLVALSAAYRAVGLAKANEAIKRWRTCVLANSFPGYSPRISYAEPKPWDLAQAEELTGETLAADEE
jgi:hypothetical protein